MCGETTVQKYRPFCSRRCADRDLARWFNGTYAVPSRDPEDIEAAIEAISEQVQERDKPH